MTVLRGFNVILQACTGSPGGGTCEGFTGVAVARPAWIVLLSEGTSGADSSARALATALRTVLLSLDPAAGKPPVPCHGVSHGLGCLAESEPACSKLLVWLADQGAAQQSLHELRASMARYRWRGDRRRLPLRHPGCLPAGGAGGRRGDRPGRETGGALGGHALSVCHAAFGRRLGARRLDQQVNGVRTGMSAAHGRAAWLCVGGENARISALLLHQLQTSACPR